MRDNYTISSLKTPMLSWIVLPLLGVWLILGYVIGLTYKPVWIKREDHENTEVIASQNRDDIGSTISEPSPIPLLQWYGESLITIWFDDTWLSQYTVGFPLVESYNYDAALAVPTRFVGFDSYMSWAQIKRVQHFGWEIASHSRSHNCDEKRFTQDQLNFELIGAKSDLENQGLRTDNYVMPCGVESHEMIEIIKQYYLSLRTSERGLNELPIKDPYAIKAYVLTRNDSMDDIRSWIETARNTNSWLILVFHQIDNSNQEYAVTVQTFNQILKTVQDSGLQVVLPSQALQIVVR